MCSYVYFNNRDLCVESTGIDVEGGSPSHADTTRRTNPPTQSTTPLGNGNASAWTPFSLVRTLLSTVSYVVLYPLTNSYLQGILGPLLPSALRSQPLLLTNQSNAATSAPPNRKIHLPPPWTGLASRIVAFVTILNYPPHADQSPLKLGVSSMRFSFEGSTQIEDVSSFMTSITRALVHTSQPQSELAVTFLYVLLARNPSLRSFLFVRSDLDNILIPILQQLYAVTSVSPTNSSRRHIHVLIILLLIFSQDSGTVSPWFRHMHIPEDKLWWYTSKRLSGGVSLGGLVILVLFRALVYNLNQPTMRDSYLQSNIHALLLNVAVHAEKLDWMVSNR